MSNAGNLYTTYPPDTQVALRSAQNDLLNSIKNMYAATSSLGITESTKYAQASAVEGLTYNSVNDGVYQFSSTTAIRNIEPWGLKYTFTVDNNTVTKFVDYGAVVLTDKDSAIDKSNVSVDDLLKNKNSLMYSYSKNNVYLSDENAVEIYYVENMIALDFDKNTYVAFYVKDSDGNVYFSNVVSNSYNSIASADTSENANLSQSISNYSNALIYYNSLIEKAENNNA